MNVLGQDSTPDPNESTLERTVRQAKERQQASDEAVEEAARQQAEEGQRVKDEAEAAKRAQLKTDARERAAKLQKKADAAAQHAGVVPSRTDFGTLLLIGLVVYAFSKKGRR